MSADSCPPAAAIIMYRHNGSMAWGKRFVLFLEDRVDLVCD
ncbi:hypothetical protein ANO14919_134040 [Xylariales sp. No.14919]|nr:hypothetical protein ANO14919_134040 [Xylariales sp. No.14919]